MRGNLTFLATFLAVLLGEGHGSVLNFRIGDALDPTVEGGFVTVTDHFKMHHL